MQDKTSRGIRAVFGAFAVLFFALLLWASGLSEGPRQPFFFGGALVVLCAWGNMQFGNRFWSATTDELQ
jgi:hypothetical protein